MWSILILVLYLDWTKLTLRIDYDALRWTLGRADGSEQLARWRLRISESEYEVQYRSGVKHNVADAMSCLITNGLEEASVEDDIPCFTIQLF